MSVGVDLRHELAAGLDRLLDGDEPLAPEDSDNAVTDVPDGFKDWLNDNYHGASYKCS